MKSLLRVPADAIGRLTPDALELDCALRARGMGDVADELLLAKLEPGIVGVKVTGTASIDPPVMWQQHPVDHPYASGKAINLGVTTIAGGGSAAADLITAGYQWLTVFGRIGNATTPATGAGDANPFANVYEDDGVALFPSFLAQDFTEVAAALSGSVSAVARRYFLGGIDKVSLRLGNNNVGALQGGTLIYFLQK